MFSRTILAAGLALAVSFGSGISTLAATVVAPNTNAAVEGDSNNAFPLSNGGDRYQQVYNASLFGGLTGAITEIAFRLDANAAAFANEVLNLEVNLSHVTTAAGSLSTSFASNIGSDQTNVLNGSVTLSGSVNPSGTNPFDIILDVADTFIYNGVDNLLLDVAVFSGSIGRQMDSVRFAPGATDVQRLFANSSSATSGSTAGDRGLVTQFSIGDAVPPIPLPASMPMLLAAFGAAGLVMRRKAKS